jgi:hypothetical protein
MMIQSLILPPDSFYQANELMMARVSVVKSAMSYLLLPNLHMDNSFFMTSTYKFTAADMYELFGEVMIYAQRKTKARRLSLQESDVCPFDRT